jgi:hypothetical protein
MRVVHATETTPRAPFIRFISDAERLYRGFHHLVSRNLNKTAPLSVRTDIQFSSVQFSRL